MPAQPGRPCRSRPRLQEQAEVEVKAERILSLFQLNLSLGLNLLVSGLRTRIAVLVSAAVGQHLV
jgi:hypothetical protein